MQLLAPAHRGVSRNPSCWVTVLFGPLICLVALLWTAGALGICAAAELAVAPREYEIKAAFIYNFTKFVEWPARSFPDAQTPLVIGVLGQSPCADALERLVKDRKMNGRAIAIRRIESAKQLETAQVLFVGNAQEPQLASLMQVINATGILTVGESATFASMGGTINFVRQEDKVRFEINLHSAEQAGLKISAQLLKLASAVRENP